MGARERIVLGRYPVEASAGIGALGTVFASRDGSDAIAITQVAIDIEAPQQRAAVLRHVRQRVATRAFVHHPGLLAVRDCVEDGDDLYVITERFGGTPLDRVYGARTPHILDWFDAICDLLGELHEAGVFSGTLTPDSFLLDERGRLRLVDFGLADAFSTTSRGGGHALDAVHYQAPELFTGAPPDARSDLFALGATLQGLLFDRPFTASANRYLPRPARDFISSLTAVSAGDRPASLAEVRQQWPQARACLAAWSRPSITMTTQAPVQAATCLYLEAADDGEIELTDAVAQVIGRMAGRPPVLEEVGWREAVIVATAPPRVLLGLVDAVRGVEGVPPLRIGLHCGAWSGREQAVVDRLVGRAEAAARASRGGAVAATWACARALQGADMRLTAPRLVEADPGLPLVVYRVQVVQAPEVPELVLRAPFASPSGICLRVTAGDVAGLVVGLPRGDVELGRGESTTIGDTRLTLAEPTISRTQARLVWDERREGFSIHHDSGATNATHVNNLQVEVEELTIGDTVRMGRLVFTLDRDPSVSQPAPGDAGA